MIQPVELGKKCKSPNLITPKIVNGCLTAKSHTLEPFFY